MSNEISAPQEPSTGEAAPRELASREKALRWFELGLVLSVSFGTSLLASFRFVTYGAGAAQPQQTADWSYLIFQEVVGLLLLGYVLWRRRMTFRDLGLRWSSSTPLVGVLIAVAGYLSYAVGYTLIHLVYRALFHSAAQIGPTPHQVFGHPTLLSIPLVVLNPLFEEMIVRAYLMKEIRDLTGSWLLAGAASVVVQTTYHLYYGWLGALSLGFQFLVFSIYYARKQKATPVVLAHGILDVWGMSQLWRAV
jgi:membrane protease YdiL (CAAX protease family)